MNVVVNVHAMNTYQLIFRHLFELKCVERELNKVWKIYQRARRVSRQAACHHDLLVYIGMYIRSYWYVQKDHSYHTAATAAGPRAGSPVGKKI